MTDTELDDLDLYLNPDRPGFWSGRVDVRYLRSDPHHPDLDDTVQTDVLERYADVCDEKMIARGYERIDHQFLDEGDEDCPKECKITWWRRPASQGRFRSWTYAGFPDTDAGRRWWENA